ncbi:hypothetical protein MMC21_006138 [Puttea exsequens]|nr:hypothetical protein [Puttea exsequens]
MATEGPAISLDVDWNSTGANVDMVAMTAQPVPEAVVPNAVIHQVTLDYTGKDVFVPDELRASIGDIVLFAPVDDPEGEQLCHADEPLDSLNFSRLLMPFLVMTELPAVFCLAQHQHECGACNDINRTFTLNSVPRSMAQPSIVRSLALPTLATGLSDRRVVYIGTGTASMFSAASSWGAWPTGSPASNSSLWATGSPGPPPSSQPFSGRASTKKALRRLVGVIIACCYIVAVL